MRNAYFAAALVLAPLVAAGASPASSYVVQTKADLFGYYQPTHEVRVGAFKLIDIALGAPDDFRKYARNERFGGTWAPVLLEFAPADAKQEIGEGGAYWKGSFRVLPTSYSVSDQAIVFAGTDKRLGSVSFRGKLDLAALKAEKKIGNGGSGKIVLRGDLAAQGKTVSGIAFTWFGGD